MMNYLSQLLHYQSGEIEKSEITIPNNVSLEFNDDGLLLAINFKNVWNRSSLLIFTDIINSFNTL